MANSGSGEINNFYYSFNIGPAHIISFSTEYYYYQNNNSYQNPNYYTPEHIDRQLSWLEDDLQKANQNRSLRPWIIAIGHKPFYCATTGNCAQNGFENKDLTEGILINGTLKYGLESLFYKNGVDLYFCGHNHYYNRLKPVYNNQTMIGTSGLPYKNPIALIEIVTGIAGTGIPVSFYRLKVLSFRFIFIFFSCLSTSNIN